MPKKDFSVKCELNEKNKTAIQWALSDALGIDFSLWHGDSFEGKDEDGKMTFQIKISESLASNGYKIKILFEETGIGIFLSYIRAAILIVMSFYTAKGVAFLVGNLMGRLNMDITTYEKIFEDGKGGLSIWGYLFGIACFVVGCLVVDQILKIVGWVPRSKAVLKKIDLVAKELNL